MKISQVLLPVLAVGSASAFAPSTPSRAFVVRPLAMESSDEGGALVPIKEETVEFTAGILGGVAGFAIGGPVLGALGAAAANFASKTDQEVGVVISNLSKTSIEVYNYLATLDSKYALLEKAQSSLETTLDKVKTNPNVSAETVSQVETALASTTDKIKEINEEYDLVGGASTAFSLVGELVEKAVKKAGELNDEYKLTAKAVSALESAVDKASEKAKEVSL